MLEIALHAGTEHPNLAWVIVPSILSLVAGLAIGRYSRRTWPTRTDTQVPQE